VLAEVGAFHGVEQVAAGAVRLGPARRVGEREEHTAAVTVEPVEVERLLFAGELEARARKAGERVRRFARGCDLAMLALRRLDGPMHAQCGVVIEVAQLCGARRRLRVRAEELFSHVAPPLPRALGLRLGTDLRVQPEDAALPVE